MVEAMRKRELDVTYSRLDGVGHNVWNYAYNDTLFEWMMGKVRK